MLLKILGLAAFILFVAALALSLRLSIGPIPLNFLKNDLEGAFRAKDGSYEVRLEKMELTWEGVVEGLGLTMRQVRIMDGEGVVVSEAPEVTMAFSIPAALGGILAPSEIGLQRPRIRLLRRREDATKKQIDEAQADSPVLEGLFAGILDVPDPKHPFGYVTEVRVVGADITIDDQKMETSWRLSRLDLHLFRDDEEISGDYAIELELHEKRARFVGEVSRRYAAEKIRLGVDFHEVEPAMFANAGAPFDQIGGLKIPVSGTAALAFLLDGTLEEVNFDLTSGEGQVAIPGIYDEAVNITRGELRGMVSAGLGRFNIDEFFINFGGPTLKVAVREEPSEDKLLLKGDVEIRDMPIDKLPKYWPPEAYADVREWVDEELSYGGISETSATFSAVVDPRDKSSIKITSINGTLKFYDLDVEYADDFPPITGVDGTAIFDKSKIEFMVTEGKHEELTIVSGTVLLHELEGDNEQARVDLNIEAPVQQALETLDHPELRYLEKIDLSLDRFEGEAAIHLLVDFPLLDDLSLEDLEVTSEAILRKASFKEVLPGVDLLKGELRVEFEGSHLSVGGAAEIGGVPAQVLWQENFSGKADFQSRYILKARMVDGQRKTFGYSGGPFISGPTDVDLVYTSKNNEGALTISLDLADAGIHMPGFKWSKPAGAPGKANLLIDFVKGKIRRIRRLTVTAEDMEVEGILQFASDGATLKWARFERLKFGVTDIWGKVTREPNGRFDAKLVGRGFNAEKLLFGGESDVELPPLKLALALDHVRLGPEPEERINRLVGSMEHDGKRWVSILLDGDFEKRGTMKLVVKPEEKIRRLVLTSNAGGAVMESLGLLKNMHGGELVLSGTFHDDEEPDIPLRGRLKMKDFRAINAPVLAKVLSVASLTGILDLLQGKGVEFKRLDVPFILTESETTIVQGRAFGPSLGITFEGKIDNVKKTVNIEGTVIPAYTINRALGEVPLIGKILVGGEGEGVFALNYKAEGPKNDPEISVNMLSALTPGFFRNFFDVFEKKTEASTPSVTLPKP